jgi:GNAT superfamily N-acetyltransferase
MRDSISQIDRLRRTKAGSVLIRFHRNAIQVASCDRRRRECDRELFFASYRLLIFLPMVHTIEGYHRFVASVMLKECAVTVVEDDTGIISFLTRQGEEVRQLYTRPDRIGRSAGTRLVEAAKASGVAALELWCFQANARARRFYEARGFHAIFTDGAGNEERTPDVRYRLEPPSNLGHYRKSPFMSLSPNPWMAASGSTRQLNQMNSPSGDSQRGCSASVALARSYPLLRIQPNRVLLRPSPISA